MTGPVPPGAQTERTRLAWRRTTLASSIATALGLRSALLDPNPAAYAAAALGALGWLTFLAVAHRRIRALSGSGTAAADGRAVRATVFSVLALAVVFAAVLWW